MSRATVRNAGIHAARTGELSPYHLAALGWLDEQLGDRFWTGIALSYLLCASSLPAMVLAWNMPSEPQDDAA